MALLPRPVMMMIWSQPAATASSTPYWMMGLSTSGSISLGWALVAGRKRVPNPAAGKTALRTRIGSSDCTFRDYRLTNVMPKHEELKPQSTQRITEETTAPRVLEFREYPLSGAQI